MLNSLSSAGACFVENNFTCIISQQLSETGDDRDVDAENNLTARIPSWKGVAQPHKVHSFFC